jgi:hypothetical protein
MALAGYASNSASIKAQVSVPHLGSRRMPSLIRRPFSSTLSIKRFWPDSRHERVMLRLLFKLRITVYPCTIQQIHDDSVNSRRLNARGRPQVTEGVHVQSETHRAGARPRLLRFCLAKLLGSGFRRHLVIEQEVIRTISYEWRLGLESLYL